MVEENRVLREVVALYTQLSGLAVQDSDLRSVVALIADRLGVGAMVIDDEHDVLASAGPSPQAVEDVHHQLRQLDPGKVLAASARARRAITLPGVDDDVALVVAPIVTGEEIPAYLLTGRPAGGGAVEDLGLLATEHAAMICGIVLGRHRLVASVVGNARLDLVEALLLARDRSEFELHNWARHLGIDDRRPHVVMTVALEPPRGGRGGSAAGLARLAAFVERLLTARLSEATVARRDTNVVAIVAVGEDARAAVDEVTAVGRLCRTSSEARYPGSGVNVGVGGVCRGLADFARSYAEARLAAETTIRMTRLGGVVAFRDLGIQRLLSRVADVEDLRAFAADVLGELVAHERTNSTDYLGTLSVYFQQNDSPKRTAKIMYLHPNTVTYRVRRVEEITGLSLSSYRDRLTVQVALEILNGLGDER
ncbi:helix-turn-helix domain-containing protein [Phytohabitans sp. ZYX-F-186]|uniref:Helix-turn-helix domain-containing protein n=1 Tax=Phytohabitans maris TaxID=3071409 RepID=A0ABU0ZM80_9ACTN|nr:helix-turn-helix domain-containing protein [Phytohabitans sp. ZYX-F-186]MDQ7907517.1 helix-turn-helix domain-containing protein [Phytohabitans sp. ZYX-F-186]